MNDNTVKPAYEANLEVAKKALEIVHGLELPSEKGAQKAYDCMLAGKKHIEDLETGDKLRDDKIIFLVAYTRDIVDTLMATLFRLNKLADQEELVKEYYALTSKEQIDQWAVELKQQHDAKQEIVKKQVEEQNAADEEMREFQNILMGRANGGASDASRDDNIAA